MILVLGIVREGGYYNSIKSKGWYVSRNYSIKIIWAAIGKADRSESSGVLCINSTQFGLKTVSKWTFSYNKIRL